MHVVVFTVLLLLLICFAQIQVALGIPDLHCAGVDTVTGASTDLIASLRDSIRTASWDCAKKIVGLVQQQQLAPSSLSVFEAEQRLIIDEMNKLKLWITSSNSNSASVSKISPAFQWAQSKSEILLNVKFSHKIDAPATLNVEPLNVTLGEKSLYLHASDGTKHFGLDLNLYSNIIANESTWSMASVGRMTFQLKKEKNPSRWPRLINKSSNSKKLKMHMWIEMQEKYAKEMEDLEVAESEKTTKTSKDKVADAAAASTPKDQDQKVVENAASEPGLDSKEAETSSGNENENMIKNDAATNVAANLESINKTDGSSVDPSPSSPPPVDDPQLKARIQALDDERKRRRKEVDVRSKIEKESIEKDISERKKELIQSWNSYGSTSSETSSEVDSNSNLADNDISGNGVLNSVVVE